MKIPKIFTPDKDLETKIEELKKFKEKGPVEVTLEEFKENDSFILYGGTEFPEKDEIIENAIQKIINDTFEGKIRWEEDPKLEEYKAKALVLNYEYKPIIIPILFMVASNIGFLYLGDKHGRCRNTYDKKVKKLAIEYFKIDPEYLKR